MPLFAAAFALSWLTLALKTSTAQTTSHVPLPAISSFDAASVQSLIDNIQAPHNDNTLAVGYFLRRGQPPLSQVDGYGLVNAALAKEPMDSDRWFLLETVKAFAALRVDGISPDDSFAAYESIFTEAVHAQTPIAVEAIREAVREFVFSVPGRINDLQSVLYDQLAGKLLPGAWTAYHELPPGQQSDTQEPVWLDAIQHSCTSATMAPLVDALFQNPTTVKTVGLYKLEAALNTTSVPSRAVDLLAQAPPSNEAQTNDSNRAIQILFSYKTYSPGRGSMVVTDATRHEGQIPVTLWAGQAVRLQALTGSAVNSVPLNATNQSHWFADPAGEPVAGYKIAPDKSTNQVVRLTYPGTALPDGAPVDLSSPAVHWYWLREESSLEARYAVFGSDGSERFGSASFNTVKPKSEFNASFVLPCAWKSTRLTYGMGLGYYQVSGLGSKTGANFDYRITSGPTWDDGRGTPLGTCQLLQFLNTWKSTSTQTDGDCLAGLQRPILDHGDWPGDDSDTPADYDLTEPEGNELKYSAVTYLTWKYPDGISVPLKKIDWSFDIDVDPSDIPLAKSVGLFNPSWTEIKPRSGNAAGIPTDDDIAWNSNCTVGDY